MQEEYELLEYEGTEFIRTYYTNYFWPRRSENLISEYVKKNVSITARNYFLIGNYL